MKNLVSFIVIIISTLVPSAQTNLFILTGKVVKEDGKTPLPYANVMLKGNYSILNHIATFEQIYISVPYYLLNNDDEN